MTGDPSTIARNPLGLVEVLRDYGVEECGSLFIYLPTPRDSADQEMWAWLQTARMFDVVRGGPWRAKVARTADWLRRTHPKLFRGDPVFFEVYRLDRERLQSLVDKLSE